MANSNECWCDTELNLYGSAADWAQVILPPAPGVSNEGGSSPLLPPCRLFLGPGFRLAARWNRLVETVKTRKRTDKTGKKCARYAVTSVEEGS